jgi:hypothetical protein
MEVVMKPHKIINIRNGNLVYRFNSRQEAEQWLASYGVSQEYKDINYKIVEC